MALFAVVIWGASPVATKLGVNDIPPLAFAALRTSIGALAALPLALAMRVPLPRDRRTLGLLALSAFGGFVGFPLLFTIGVQRTSANHASMILAFLPVLTGAFAMAADRRVPRAAWWVGCAVAVAGELLLVLGRGGPGRGPDGSTASLAGDALVVVSNLFAAAGYVAGGRLKQAGYPVQGATFWGIVLAACMLLPALPWLLDGVNWAGTPPAAWAGVAYMAFAVSVVGYLAWYWALAKGGIARVGLFQFLQPISGLTLALLLLGERPDATLAIATILILAGVFVAARPGAT